MKLPPSGVATATDRPRAFLGGVSKLGRSSSPNHQRSSPWCCARARTSHLKLGSISRPVAPVADVVNRGFLVIVAPFYANLTLFFEIAMGVGLLIGALLARRRHFRAHAWCQSLIVPLNLALISIATFLPNFCVSHESSL
jgi:hypothetical protein